ncbi:MAG: J domain-containing protein [Rhodospirillales bacterium]|nr:MAG: J domain-containing protein [Rhodospirillales bacterium]
MPGRRRKSVSPVAGAAVAGRVCERPGCAAAGEFRAPKSRAQLNHYRWFCLEHVREYNSKWDFYAGMDAASIEAQLRADQTWRRPTWQMGARKAAAAAKDPFEILLDPYDILADSDILAARQRRTPAAQTNGLTPSEQQALSILDLGWPQTFEAVRARYKELAKRHHPDANGGSKEAEERLKLINHAYSTLKQSPHFTAE